MFQLSCRQDRQKERKLTMEKEIIVQIVSGTQALSSPSIGGTATVFGLTNYGRLFSFDGQTGEWKLKSNGDLT